jgi:hypothetical protein
MARAVVESLVSFAVIIIRLLVLDFFVVKNAHMLYANFILYHNFEKKIIQNLKSKKSKNLNLNLIHSYLKNNPKQIKILQSSVQFDDP